MSKTALVLIASGTEEMEFVIAADVLSRAGIQVTTAGVPEGDLLQCAVGVQVKPDVGISEAKSKGPYDIIVLPGGRGGSLAFGKSEVLGEMLKEQERCGKWIGAICAERGKNISAAACQRAIPGVPMLGGKRKNASLGYGDPKVVVLRPIALAIHGIGIGKNVTCYPKAWSKIEEIGNKYNYTGEKVVVDGNLITSLGPSTCFDFTLLIVEKLLGREKAVEIADILLVTY